MRAFRLLKAALDLPCQHVADCAVGHGNHAMAFLSKGRDVTGIDLSPAKIRHPRYRHLHRSFEDCEIEADMVWSCHTLEHVTDTGVMLRAFRDWLKPGGWLALAVPPSPMEYFHVGHLTLWTPAHLLYNLVVAGWDCREARWYTEYHTIGVLVQKTDDIGMRGRTAMPSEIDWLNQYMPVTIEHEGNAWLENRWPEPTGPRATAPRRVVAGARW